MKYLFPICVLLASSITAYGQQQPAAGLRIVMPNEQQPDPTGQRLQYLRRTAYELDQNGDREQAAAVRRQADFEQQALLRRLDVLQAEAQQIRQATGTGTQVLVQLQIAEVSLTKLRSLGFDCSKLPGDPSATPNLNQPHGSAQSVIGVTDSTETQQFFEALRKDNLLKVIAEPRLVTLSGRTAVMRTGEALSVPKQQPDGSTTIEQRSGIEVEVTPEVLGDKIQLAFELRLAEADRGSMIRVGKESIPVVKRTECATHTELKNNQTLVIRGLTRTREEAENRGVPCLSEIPYIGAPFRKVTVTRNETAILIFVRPEIMQPLAPRATPVAGLQENLSMPQPISPVNGPGITLPSTAHRPIDAINRR